MPTSCQSCKQDFRYDKILRELWNLRGGFRINCAACGRTHDTSMTGQIKITAFLVVPSLWAAIAASTFFQSFPAMVTAGLVVMFITMGVFSLLVPYFSWFGDRMVGEGAAVEGGDDKDKD